MNKAVRTRVLFFNFFLLNSFAKSTHNVRNLTQEEKIYKN